MARPRNDDSSSTLIDSTKFDNVLYQIKNDHLILFGGKSGTIAIRIDLIPDLIEEVKEIGEMYEGSRI
jgi:hypothetical protein